MIYLQAFGLLLGIVAFTVMEASGFIMLFMWSDREERYLALWEKMLAIAAVVALFALAYTSCLALLVGTVTK